MDKNDTKITLISQKAREFGVDFAQNENILKMLFETHLKADKNDFEAIKEIFKALEIIKTNSQMSG